MKSIIVLILVLFTMYSCNEKQNIRFKVVVNSQNQILLNNSPIDLLELEKQTEKFVRREKSNSIILLEAERSLKYKDYVVVKNSIEKEVKKLRERSAIEKFNKPYEELNRDQRLEILETYPRDIISESVYE